MNNKICQTCKLGGGSGRANIEWKCIGKFTPSGDDLCVFFRVYESKPCFVITEAEKQKMNDEHNCDSMHRTDWDSWVRRCLKTDSNVLKARCPHYQEHADYDLKKAAEKAKREQKAAEKAQKEQGSEK